MNLVQRFLLSCHSLRCHSQFGFIVLLGTILGVQIAGIHHAFAQQAGDEPHTLPSTAESIAVASRADAGLNDIVAISADRLCVVGDSGTILITENAGRSWTSVDSPTSDSLYAVRFVDSKNGIAVGGSIGRFTGISRATILRTADGGDSWELIENDLPLLRGLAHSAGTGNSESLTKWICWGDFDAARSTGVFYSASMGQTWEPTAAQLGSTVACDLADPNADTFLAWDTNERCQFVSQQSRSPISTRRTPGPVALTRGLHNSGRFWLAYGASGMLERSVDGQAWEAVELPLSPAARELFTWQGVSQLGEHLWVCGNPGSVLLHSNDFGENWRRLSLPNSLPLKRAAFVDSNRGWAVGALGTILATRDGGDTWYRQRGAKSSGVLAISDNLTSTPWDALGTNAWESKRTSTALLLRGPPHTVDLSFGPATKAVSSVPGSGDTYLNSNVGGISVQAAPTSIASSPDELAATIGTYAPEIVIASPEIAQQLYAFVHSGRGSTSPLKAEILQEAGLSNAFSSVQKIVVPCNPESADFQDSTQRILKGVGVSTWDALFALPPRLQNKRSSTAYKTLWCRSHNAAAKTSLAGGVVHSRGADRSLAPQQLGNYQLVMGRVHRQKLLQQLQSTKLPPTEWNQRLSFAIRRTPASERSTQLWAMYEALASQPDEWKRDFVLQQLAKQTDDHDASTWAMIRILKAVSSAEMHHARAQVEPKEQARNTDAVPVISAQFRTISDAETPWNASPFSSTVASPESQSETTAQPQVITAGATQKIPAVNGLSAMADRWFRLMGSFSQVEPRLLALPSMQIMDYRVALARAPDGATEAQRLERMLESPLFGIWQQNALQELRIERRRLADIRGLLIGARAQKRPQLDGKLDEPLWKQATEMAARVPSSLPSSAPYREQSGNAVVRWAYDDDFLYAGIQCSSSGRPLAAAPKQRTYDADLSQMDRVEIHLDTNRDYATSFHFGIAANGETFDRCGDMVGYNPTWYVAVANEHSGTWSAEVAIARDALTDNQFLDQIWGVSAARFSNVPDAQYLKARAVSPSQPQLSLLAPHYLMFEPRAASGYQPARIPRASQGRRIAELPPLGSK